MRPTKLTVIAALTQAMNAMQDDPELEDVDTLSLMEDAISDALEYFTGERRTTRQHEKEDDHVSMPEM